MMVTKRQGQAWCVCSERLKNFSGYEVETRKGDNLILCHVDFVIDGNSHSPIYTPIKCGELPVVSELDKELKETPRPKYFAVADGQYSKTWKKP